MLTMEGGKHDVSGSWSGIILRVGIDWFLISLAYHTAISLQ